jgi:MFS family permease
MNPASTPARLSMSQVLLCGAAIVTLSMGIRHGFGLFLQPITMDRGWTRETFAFAMALQNLAWGLAGPVAGMWADRFGAFRVLVVGAVLYALGLVTMAWPPAVRPLPAAPGCCWAWRSRARPTR